MDNSTEKKLDMQANSELFLLNPSPRYLNVCVNLVMNIAKASGKTQAQKKLSHLIGTKMKPGLYQ